MRHRLISLRWRPLPRHRLPRHQRPQQHKQHRHPPRRRLLSPHRPAPKANGQGGRILASPLAKRLAKQNNIDLALLAGSGPRGRVVKRDIEKALKDGVPQAAPAARAPVPMAPTDQEVLALFEEGSYEVVAHDGMRKIIAERLQVSKQTIPHFYLTITCELDNLLALRAKLNDRAPKDADGKPAYKLSVNDFIIKALAQALQQVPDANVTWTDSGMLKHTHSDVGVAVAVGGRSLYAGDPGGRNEGVGRDFQ